MVNVLHKALTGADAVHPAAFVQSADPGAVGPNLQWIDTTTGPPYILKLRNAANTAWLLFAAGTTGPTGSTGPIGPTGSITTSLLVSGVAPYVCVQDQKASGTDGGTFTSGAWQTRVLNAVTANDQNLVTLAANQITLPAGLYRCNIAAPAFGVNYNTIRLQNITAGATWVTGASVYSDSSAIPSCVAVIRDRFSLASASVLEVQHRCSITRATTGFGPAVGAFIGGVLHELYTVAEFWLEGPPPPFRGSTDFSVNPRVLAARRQDQQQHSLNTPPQ